MAIEVREGSQGTRCKVRLRRPDGSEYSKTFRTKKDAVDFERTQQADQVRAYGPTPQPAARPSTSTPPAGSPPG